MLKLFKVTDFSKFFSLNCQIPGFPKFQGFLATLYLCLCYIKLFCPKIGFKSKLCFNLYSGEALVLLPILNTHEFQLFLCIFGCLAIFLLFFESKTGF